MASTVIYPPIVDNYMPAFMAGEKSYCRVNFSLSKFNSSTDFKSVQVSIKKCKTGETVVDTATSKGTTYYKDKNGKEVEATVYRGTGIILDMPFVIESADDNSYYIDINTNNLSTKSGAYNGWVPGEIYKVQLRLSKVNYGDSQDNPYQDGQSDWLTRNGNNFSEWSTVCIVKATGVPTFTTKSIVSGDGDSEKPYLSSDTGLSYFIKTNNIIGKYENKEDTSEYLHSYQMRLREIKSDGKYVDLDSSKIIYLNENYLTGEFSYLFNCEIENGKSYSLKIEYTTINGYTDSFNIKCTGRIKENERTTLQIYTIENDSEKYLSGRTNLFHEEENGRIAYLIHGQEKSTVNNIKRYFIRRCDSKDNFKAWKDIKSIAIEGAKENPVDLLFYDYTVESGVWYKYSIQLMDTHEVRSPMNITPNPCLRDFNYSFLLGQNEKQLSLKYNNTMSSFGITVNDSITQTIGGKYPFIARNGNMKYKTFPIEGLISFNMDDESLFADDKDLYLNQEVANLYKSRGQETYDYVRERIFREKVMEFLLNDKPKLFKSPTEGNVLVRITNVNFSPNQTLSRMIYSFSATATEIGEASQELLERYKIVNPEVAVNVTIFSLPGLNHGKADAYTHYVAVNEASGSDTPIIEDEEVIIAGGEAKEETTNE